MKTGIGEGGGRSPGMDEDEPEAVGILWKLRQDSLRRVVNLQVRKVSIHIDMCGQSLNTVLLPARKE